MSAFLPSVVLSLVPWLAPALAAQAFAPPPQSPQQRYVDFSDDLDRTGLVAVIGTLERLKAGIF